MTYLSINSSENLKIKILKKLTQKKYRDELGKFMVENLSTIIDAAKAGFLPESLFVTDKFITENNKEIIAIKKKIGGRNIFLISEKINQFFSDLEHPAGIAAVYAKLAREINWSSPIIYLNKISDPGNLGAIIRSALAFDLVNIVVDEGCADIFNYKTINAAKDAIFKLNIVEDSNLKLLKQIKKTMPVITARLVKSSSEELLKKHRLFCLVLGNETHGVDAAIQQLSDDFIRISMGERMESLNVSVAAAILFYLNYRKST